MQNVFRPSRRRNGKAVKSAKYRGRFTVLDDRQVFDVPLHTADRQVAEQRLRELVREKEREAVGLLDPKPLRAGAQRPLAAQLAEFVADLDARGRSGDYVRHVDARAAALLKDCGWHRAGDVTADSFEKWRAGKHASAKTLNEYLNAATAFLNWMAERNRIAANPLRVVRKVEARGRETFQRRALSVEECQRLVDGAGPRRLLYLAALTTGLRRGEIEGLRWDDVDLAGKAPAVRVRACTTKNHKEARLPLHPDLAAELARVRPALAEPGALVFPDGVPRNRDLRADYTRAGIPLADGAGNKMDFHALRHTFCTLLQRSGVYARVDMEVMRHSDMRRTDKVYNDASALPTREAVESLPRLGEYSLPDSLQASLTAVSAGRAVASCVTDRLGDGAPQLVAAVPVGHGESSPVTDGQETGNGGGGGNRTPVRPIGP